MDLSLVIIVLLVVVIGFMFILGKPKSGDKIGSDTNSGEGSPVGAESTFGSTAPSASAASKGAGGSSLLNQLSMINARSFPALSKNQLPNKIPAFFGRKDIVLEVMGRSWESGGPICLYGEKGTGKTSLAIELAQQLAPKYPDAQFYIDLQVEGDKALPVSKAMGYVLRAFFPKEPIPNDPAVLAQQYGAALKGKRVLMLLENVAKPSQVKRLMPGKPGLMIFTSGNKISITGSYAKPVKELFPDEAELLLFFLAPNSKRWAPEIIDLCGYSPLAISLTGSFLRATPEMSVDTLIRELREERQIMKPEGDFEEGEDKDKKEIVDRNVEPIFNVMFRDMRKETATVFRKLALFSGSFDEKAAANICGDRDGEHLGRLVFLGLLEHDVINKRYSFHEVIHKLIKAEVRPSEKILTHRTLAFYYFDILKDANELYASDEEALESALNLFDLDWFNIQAGQKWSALKSTEDASIAKLCGDYCKEARTLMPMRHPTDECIEWNESALTASRESENVEAEKNNLLSLGMQLYSLGIYDKANEYLEEAQSLSNKLGHVGDEKHSLDLLGQCCLRTGNFERAIECFAKVLEFVRLEGKASKEMEVLNLLAQACFQGNEYERGELNFKLALEKAQKLGNKEFQAQVLNDLGRLCNAVKKYQSALTYLKEGKTLAHQGNLRVKEMDILGNLSTTYMLTSKPKKALECLDASLDIARKTGDNREQGIILKKMGDYHKNLKDYAKAIEKYERGLPKIRKFTVLPVEYSLLENLGNAYLEIGGLEKSQICFRHARTLGKKHADRFMEAKAMWNLSMTYQKSGEFTEALTHAELASQICLGVHDNEAVDKLAEEIKEWMIRRVEDEIKDSGL
ncbi:MAG: tetratricopeptide repeat protein [Nitrospina sp.]|jgi:tetratricopeptide (TPR) repeat protein|nr:tetratricopeptide repeat protein [Nitrospina sp.]MBT3856658.1 tetratricopeptide repeat protein [Nitrospina sp.]MBT4103528.1 tetratricopeptide repeat protein [Nitrospina sp.]MBT4388765.1 tetratricopeptide repeat protein [Nitrospina sp.]MBT4619568.1 tetratricopeptide repeat protein [Nitrospina sp.]